MDSPKDELSCLAFSVDFLQKGEKFSRGVISYYAALALPAAVSLNDWLRSIDEKARADVEQKKLDAVRQPKLKIIGNSNNMLSGTAVR